MRTHPILVGSVARNLPIILLPSGVYVALFDITEDHELVEAAADELAPQIPAETQVLVMPEGKALGLLHALAKRSGLPTVVPRKKTGYLKEPIFSAALSSITTEKTQTLYIGADQIEKLQGRKCLFLDDVVSRGQTLEACRKLIVLAESTLVGVMAVFTEGKERRTDVTCVDHLPIFDK
jgi:adenine phosphoribosyltransferase